MFKFCCLLATVFLMSCKTTTYYIVRHGEKETNTMVQDVPLSAEGKLRAEALKVRLKGKVDVIATTNFLRTKGTAQPLAEGEGKTVLTYTHTDTAFLGQYKKGKQNVLFVGHSNTVDDIVNYFLGRKELSDLPDTSYGDLFIIRKKGSNFSLEKAHFGK
jgi:broad specificity phosphatase PhoE